MSNLRACPGCGETKALSQFYRNHTTCRTCVHKKAVGVKVVSDKKLATDAERHRQEKEVKRLMKVELKKIARARLANKRRAAKKKAQLAAMPPVVADEDRPVVDPVLKELAMRELARRRLIEFIQEFHPRYMAGWVHHEICRKLEKFTEDVAAGKSPRLMILMPPRHGKSQIASKLFPAWLLGHHPHFEVIACSYNISLALDFSREVRDVVESDRYNILFPQAKMNPEARGVEAWRLLSPTGVGSGGYVAAGIGGPINGKGAHVLIIDDPIKNAEEADSAEHRQKIWNWYQSTAYSRLAPGAGVLVIQTWWHDDDLAGRLQEEMKDAQADQFEIVKFPALAVEDEPFRMVGDALHPERYDEGALTRIKRTVGPRFWAALYQQDPVPDEGAYFTKQMLVKRTGRPDPRFMHIFQAWDFAISDKKQNDFNVGVTIGLDYDDVVHVLDVVRFKTTDAGKIVDAILDAHDKHKPMVVGVEDGQIWRTMGALLKKRQTERRIYPTYEVQKPLTDKMVRARPLQGRMQQGKVTFPGISPWMADVEKEFLRFPAGAHDDMVDALAWAVTLVIGKAPPKAPKVRSRTDEKSVADRLRDIKNTGGRSAMSA